MMPILVIAPNYRYAQEWARDLGLGVTEWHYVTHRNKIMSVEGVQFHIVESEGWTKETHEARLEAEYRVLCGRAWYYPQHPNITNVNLNG